MIDWLIDGVSRGCSIHAVELLTQRIKQILEKKENKSVVNSILGNLNIKQFTFMKIWKNVAHVTGGKITTKTCKIKANLSWLIMKDDIKISNIWSSVSDPYHFDSDPDPRIRIRDDGSGSWLIRIRIRGYFWFCESDFPY